MTIDPALLEKARAAEARLADAERDTLLARADYHTAVRRLHLGGAPLREIAAALELSHQRVQQIVNAAGGSWWQIWRRRGTAGDAVCSWCGRPPAEVDKLIAGPKIYICDACIARAEQAMSGGRDRGGTLTRVTARARCGFCRRAAGAARPIIAGPQNVCADCLRVCRDILNSRAA